MITGVFYTNFKGKTGEQELSGLDLFIGLNGSGKSSVLQIPALTMLGYVPGNGKEEADTFKLSSNDTQMTVGIKTDTGFSCARTFKKSIDRVKKTGETKIKIAQGLKVSPSKQESNQTQFKERIAMEVGNFTAMFDISEFLSLSGPKRRAFISSLAPIATETWTREKVHAELSKKLLTPELLKNDPDQYKIMEKLIGDVMSQYPAGFNVSEGIQAMLGWVEPEKKFWKGKAADAQGAIRQLSELKNEEAETDRNLVKLKADREAFISEQIKLKEKVAAGTEKQKAIDDRNSRITELKGLIRDLEFVEINTDTFDLDALIQEQQSMLDNTNYPEQYERSKKLGSARKIDAETAKSIYESLKQKKVDFEADYKSLKKSMETVDGCKGSCVVDPERISCPKDFVLFKEFVAQKSAEAEKFLSEIQFKIDEAVATYQTIEADLLKIQAEMASIMEQMKKANEQNREINDKLADLQQKRNERLNAMTNRDNQVKLYRNELVRLNSQALVETPVGDLTAMQTEVGKIQDQLDELNKTIQAKETAKNDLIRIQQSLLDNKEASYKDACLKLISDELGPKGIQGEIVKETINPLQVSMQEYLGEMGFNYWVFFETESETGQENFEFGWEKGNQRVYFDTLSNGEKIIFLSALMTVIVDRANPKTRILSMDNLDNLDPVNFKLVINGLSKIKSHYDNIILAGVVQGEKVFPKNWEEIPKFNIGDFTVWNLTPKEAKVDEQQSA